MSKKMKMLTVASHPDDEIVGCGGTMHRFRDHEVWSIYFAPCPEKGHAEDYVKAMNVLEVNNVIHHNFPQDVLGKYSQIIRNILWEIRERYYPDVVLCPSPHDFHQDHKVVADCCMTIFRDTSSILGYEVLRSANQNYSANTYILLGPKDVDVKISAFNCLKTQKEAKPWFWKQDRIMANMRMRGTQVKSEHAEAFELLWGRI